VDEVNRTPSSSAPKNDELSEVGPAKRVYKKGLSEWAKSIIDMALEAGMKVMDYDGVLQPQIFLFEVARTWDKPPFMELAGRELFVKVPHNDFGHILHLRLESSYWQYPNPDDPKEIITLLFYAPVPYVKRKGVVDGHVVDVWVEPSAPKELAIETPAVEEDDGA
jgi:hypothetical protein